MSKAPAVFGVLLLAGMIQPVYSSLTAHHAPPVAAATQHPQGGASSNSKGPARSGSVTPLKPTYLGKGSGNFHVHAPHAHVNLPSPYRISRDTRIFLHPIRSLGF